MHPNPVRSTASRNRNLFVRPNGFIRGKNARQIRPLSLFLNQFQFPEGDLWGEGSEALGLRWAFFYIFISPLQLFPFPQCHELFLLVFILRQMIFWFSISFLPLAYDAHIAATLPSCACSVLPTSLLLSRTSSPGYSRI